MSPPSFFLEYDPNPLPPNVKASQKEQPWKIIERATVEETKATEVIKIKKTGQYPPGGMGGKWVKCDIRYCTEAPLQR